MATPGAAPDRAFAECEAVRRLLLPTEMSHLPWVAVAAAALGRQWADPVVGLLIAVAIVYVLQGAARDVYQRLMDAVDRRWSIKSR